MKLVCPSCHSEIAAGDINVQSAMAKCARCGEVFNFASELGAIDTAWGGKAPVDMPKGFSLTHSMSDLVITRNWFSASAFVLLFFCCFWDGFLIFWYSIGLRGHAPAIMFIFPLLHVAVGVGLTYTMLAKFLNHTVFTISDYAVSVQHGPLPWGGNKTIPAQEIDQLFCDEKISNTRNGTSVTYNVQVILKGGERLTLVSGLEQPNHAAFVEQQIESRLSIKDRPVAGEMRPV